MADISAHFKGNKYHANIADLLDVNSDHNTVLKINLFNALDESRKSGIWNNDKFDKAYYEFIFHTRDCLDNLDMFAPDYARPLVTTLRNVVNLTMTFGPYDLSNWPYDRLFADDPLYLLISNIWAGIYILSEFYNTSHQILTLMQKDIDVIHSDLIIISNKKTTWANVFKQTKFLNKRL